jgi:hypothetical protein
VRVACETREACSREEEAEEEEEERRRFGSREGAVRRARRRRVSLRVARHRARGGRAVGDVEA